MTLLAHAVKAADGRWLGIRCARCGVIFAMGATRAQEHADHTWGCVGECRTPPHLTDCCYWTHEGWRCDRDPSIGADPTR